MIGSLETIGEPSQSGFNAGYLTHLYLIRTNDLAYVHSPEKSPFLPVNALGIQPGSVITEFLLKPKTATFTEGDSQTEAGTTYNASIVVPLKGSRADLVTWIHQNSKRRYIVLTRDTLGNCYMVGSYDNGARIAWARQVTGTSTQQLTINLVNWHPIPFIPTISLDEIFPHREFDHSFDLSFS